MKRKQWISILGIITALVIFVACGSSEKPLEDKFQGKYNRKTISKKLRTSVTLHKAGKNLLVHYQEATDTRRNGTIIDKSTEMEIENALFRYDKESNTYTLVEEKIKNVKAKQSRQNVSSLAKGSSSWNSYQELVGDDGHLTITLTVNDTRNEVVLYAYTTGGKSLNFGNGFKE